MNEANEARDNGAKFPIRFPRPRDRSLGCVSFPEKGLRRGERWQRAKSREAQHSTD